MILGISGRPHIDALTDTPDHCTLCMRADRQRIVELRETDKPAEADLYVRIMEVVLEEYDSCFLSKAYLAKNLPIKVSAVCPAQSSMSAQCVQHCPACDLSASSSVQHRQTCMQRAAGPASGMTWPLQPACRKLGINPCKSGRLRLGP